MRAARAAHVTSPASGFLSVALSQFRESLGFEGSPVKFIWRGKRIRTVRPLVTHPHTSPPSPALRFVRWSPFFFPFPGLDP
jgi:hypothetical protein